MAKRLRSKTISGNLIGVLIPDFQNLFYVDVLKGIEEVAYKNNYAIIMCNFGQDEQKEKLYLDIPRSEAVDHLVMSGYKRIAYISGHPLIPFSSLREQGYRDALKKNGIDFDPELVKYGDSRYGSGVLLCDG